VTQNNNNPLNIYIQHIVPIIVLDVCSGIPADIQYFQYIQDVIKLLILVNNLSVKNSNRGILSFLLPTLIILLSNLATVMQTQQHVISTTAANLFHVVVQITLSLGQSLREEFTQELEKVPPQMKQTLQVALQLHIQREKLKEQSSVAETSSKSIDLTKF